MYVYMSEALYFLLKNCEAVYSYYGAVDCA